MSDHLKLAKKKLSPSNVEAGLPGREAQTNQLYGFLRERLKLTGASYGKTKLANIAGLQMNKTIFMCGVPGTGKTATLEHVMTKLKDDKARKRIQIHPFNYAYINVQHLARPDKLYPEILNKFKGQTVTKERSVKLLEDLFSIKPGQQISKTDNFYIVAIDEFDLLCGERKSDQLYNLFDWPTSSNTKLILVVIANAMDLSERLRGRITSRLGWDKVIFDSYTSSCLENIIKNRLGDPLLKKTFQENAIMLAVKKIGRTTGDARRLLDTCCLAIDKAIEDKSPLVTTQIISKIGFQNIDIDRLNFLNTCHPLNLMTLKSILRLVEEVGEDNIVAEDVYTKVLEDLDHLRFKKYFEGYSFEPRRFGVILNELAASSIIYLEDNKPWPLRRLYIKDSSPLFRDHIRNEDIQSKFD